MGSAPVSMFRWRQLVPRVSSGSPRSHSEVLGKESQELRQHPVGPFN